MILLCYDGSADARAAIEQAGELLGGQPATVLTVREPFIEVITHASFGLGMAPGVVNIEEIDTAAREAAQTRAQEGAEPDRVRRRQVSAKAGLAQAELAHRAVWTPSHVPARR